MQLQFEGPGKSEVQKARITDIKLRIRLEEQHLEYFNWVQL